MSIAAVAACLKSSMEDKFYSKATGKLRQSSHSSYTNKPYPKRDQSSVYSLENEEDDCAQHPVGQLSVSQKKYIEIFMNSISLRNDIQVDSNLRAIHTIGSWKSEDFKTTVVCTMIQPHITTVTVSLYGITYDIAQKYSEEYSSLGYFEKPTIVKTTRYCQVMGKYASLFVDRLIKDNKIQESRTTWTIIVLGLTQPIFHVINENTAYECKLTHASCKVIFDYLPKSATISFPTTGGQNVAFRSSELRAGNGTGPAITVHTAGTVQYQGKPDSIGIVVSAFRDCIDTVINSQGSMKFLRSLAVLRSIQTDDNK